MRNNGARNKNSKIKTMMPASIHFLNIGEFEVLFRFTTNVRRRARINVIPMIRVKAAAIAKRKATINNTILFFCPYELKKYIAPVEKKRNCISESGVITNFKSDQFNMAITTNCQKKNRSWNIFFKNQRLERK
jgi:hypothetical protein